MKRCLAFLLIFLFVFSSTTPVSARCHPSYGFEATTFGLDDHRTRFVLTSEKVAFWSLFTNRFGNSYSQPLILSGKRWGMEWPVIAALGGPEGDQRLRFWVVTRDLISWLRRQGRKTNGSTTYPFLRACRRKCFHQERRHRSGLRPPQVLSGHRRGEAGHCRRFRFNQSQGGLFQEAGGDRPFRPQVQGHRLERAPRARFVPGALFLSTVEKAHGRQPRNLFCDQDEVPIAVGENAGIIERPRGD